MFRSSAFIGGLCALSATVACSTSDEKSETAAPLPGPAEWNREVVPPQDVEASTARSECRYQAGALAAETQGASYPTGSEIPIDHVLVVMQENRSFDHYFQMLPAYGQPDVEVAPSDFSNPAPDGSEVAIYHESQYCIADTNHSWAGSHAQYNGGKMDGFVRTNHGYLDETVVDDAALLNGRRAMGYFDHTDLPFYYFLANEFAIGDNFFCSLLGPTFPNRMYMYAATSHGHVHNSYSVPDLELIVDLLEKRKIDWRIYADGTPGITLFLDTYLEYQAEHVFSMADYFADAAAGKLPAFAFVDPILGTATGTVSNNDEHPPSLPQSGERFVAEIVQALTTSPNWSRSALFLTYDEHGGLYDHVTPPTACPPDDETPILKAGDPDEGFDRLGMRVPFIVVSPYAKKHFVGHQAYDLTSILRFVEARFVLPALTRRDANALAPFEMFDFASPAHLVPPEIPIPDVPSASLQACKALFPE